MAHSFVQAHNSEYDAFREFVETFPEGTLLVDTYDTLEGVRNVIRLARELGSAFRVTAIRLDSGDLATLAKESRHLLDEAGLTNIKIFASSSIDEYLIEELLRSQAPIDGFGVGTHMGTSADSPFLDAAYKLVEYADTPRMKFSTAKTTLPGRKQVFRRLADGTAIGDVIACWGEDLPGLQLLKPVMLAGRRTGSTPSLNDSRSHCSENIRQLSPSLLTIKTADPPYKVEVSSRLLALQTECRRKLAKST